MPRISNTSVIGRAACGAVVALLAAATDTHTVVAQRASSHVAVAQPASMRCRNTGNFDRWLEAFRQEALGKGITRQTLAAAAPLMVYDQRFINIDRGQKIFQQSFIDFSNRLVSKNRIQNGAAHIRKHAAIFARQERQYGVPAPVIAAFWGLESDFGSNMGKDMTLKSLTTLAYDCRRSEMFRGHLHGAMALIQRGDLRPEEMIGSWAGELGQTQFMPSEYMAHAIDYDGDGKRNLLRSPADVIGSTGKYLVHLGWRRGEPWLQEVDVPAKLAWHEADLTIQHPRSQWVKWGVTGAHGSKLPADGMQASLLLPMGRFGPAFLAYPNFKAYVGWNESLIYSLTAAHYATRLAGAPPMLRGRSDIPSLKMEQISDLQRLLARRGYKVGEIDGKVGAQTRAAVRQAQMKVGLPADSYPTAELIDRLRR
jgi:lytic murein transglycosylase